MRLVVLPGVFRPLSDSWLLARAGCAEPLAEGASVLELCCGSAAAGIAAARCHHGRLTTVDVSRRAALTARLNGALNGVPVRARRGDLFTPVGGERFDLILANPPYVPAPTDDLPVRGPERAWDAGRDGRALLDRICAEAPSHLAPGGAVLVVHSELIGRETTLSAFADGGLEPGIAARHVGELGPLMEGRRQHLESRGMLAPGQRREEVLVLRGRAPHARGTTPRTTPAPVGTGGRS